MYLKTIIVLSAASVIFVGCSDLILGDTGIDTRLSYHTVAQYQAISFSRRIKYIYYSSPDMTTIRGIKLRDNLNSSSTANIIVGGIGFTFVNLRLASERGRPLDYIVEIYT